MFHVRLILVRCNQIPSYYQHASYLLKDCDHVSFGSDHVSRLTYLLEVITSHVPLNTSHVSFGSDHLLFGRLNRLPHYMNFETWLLTFCMCVPGSSVVFAFAGEGAHWPDTDVATLRLSPAWPLLQDVLSKIHNMVNAVNSTVRTMVDSLILSHTSYYSHSLNLVGLQYIHTAALYYTTDYRKACSHMHVTGCRHLISHLFGECTYLYMCIAWLTRMYVGLRVYSADCIGFLILVPQS